MAKHGISPEALLSVALALTPLGGVQISDDARKITVPTESAADFLKSWGLGLPRLHGQFAFKLQRLLPS